MSAIVSRRDMEDLPARIRGAINARGSENLGLQFTPDIALRIARAMTNQAFKVEIADTADDARADLAEVNKLTRQQFHALKGVFDFPNVAVIGPAGSGKTLVAIWRLKALVGDGRRAIYVCFNKYLAEWLRASNPELAEHIHSMHRMFMAMIGSRGPGAGETDEFFASVLPNMVFDHASSLEESVRYDAIIVDEGQDLGELSELALREMLKRSGGQWVLFADERQNLYQSGSERSVTADVVFRLHHNCRNTERVNAATNKYCNHKIESIPEIARGVVPLIECPGGVQAQAQAVWRLCRDMRALGSIAVLSPVRLENSVMNTMRRGHGLDLSTELESLGRPDTVFFSTIKAFKGIEAAVVIVADVDVPDTTVPFPAEDLYVACTRPTARLAIICKSTQARDWFVGRALPES